MRRIEKRNPKLQTANASQLQSTHVFITKYLQTIRREDIKTQQGLAFTFTCVLAHYAIDHLSGRPPVNMRNAAITLLFILGALFLLGNKISNNASNPYRSHLTPKHLQSMQETIDNEKTFNSLINWWMLGCGIATLSKLLSSGALTVSTSIITFTGLSGFLYEYLTKRNDEKLKQRNITFCRDAKLMLQKINLPGYKKHTFADYLELEPDPSGLYLTIRVSDERNWKKLRCSVSVNYFRCILVDFYKSSLYPAGLFYEDGGALYLFLQPKTNTLDISHYEELPSMLEELQCDINNLTAFAQILGLTQPILVYTSLGIALDHSELDLGTPFVQQLLKQRVLEINGRYLLPSIHGDALFSELKPDEKTIDTHSTSEEKIEKIDYALDGSRPFLLLESEQLKKPKIKTRKPGLLPAIFYTQPPEPTTHISQSIHDILPIDNLPNHYVTADPSISEKEIAPRLLRLLREGVSSDSRIGILANPALKETYANIPLFAKLKHPRCNQRMIAQTAYQDASGRIIYVLNKCVNHNGPWGHRDQKLSIPILDTAPTSAVRKQ